MPGMYTIVVTDKKGRYNKLFGSLVLTTDVQPVKYSADAKKPALLRADGATDEEFKNYIFMMSSTSLSYERSIKSSLLYSAPSVLG